MPINVVVDLSHHNGNPDFVTAKANGIEGVIHKATQGTKLVDSMYLKNRKQAKAAELLWGAYHFGVRGDGAKQADRFLEIVQPDVQTLLVLDYEPYGDSTMTLNQARDFVTRVKIVTGRFPGLYSGSLIKEQLGNKPKDPILSNCFLWIAQYAAAPKNIPPTWATWTLWQYTDGKVGAQPHSVPGIGVCDRDQFNGTLQSLFELWGVATAVASVGNP